MPGKVPAALELGEIAVGFHTSDPVLWLRDTEDQVVRVTKRVASLPEVLAGLSTDTIVTPWTLAQLLADWNPGQGHGGGCNGINGGDVNGVVWIDGGESWTDHPSCIADGGVA